MMETQIDSPRSQINLMETLIDSPRSQINLMETLIDSRETDNFHIKSQTRLHFNSEKIILTNMDVQFTYLIIISFICLISYRLLYCLLCDAPPFFCNLVFFFKVGRYHPMSFQPIPIPFLYIQLSCPSRAVAI